MKKEKETTENPKVNSGDKFICKICDQTFSFKKMLKKHNQTYHTPSIKCKLCDKTFEKTCDLEFPIKVDHDSFETLQCEKCDKTFPNVDCLNMHEKTTHTQRENGGISM